MKSMRSTLIRGTTVLLALVGCLNVAFAATWTGVSGNDWFVASNWDPSGVPNNASTVTVPSGAAILLTNETAELASFTMAGGTMTFSNWMTRRERPRSSSPTVPR